jgi:hypothetical protein
MLTCPAVWKASMARSRKVERVLGGVAGAGLAVVLVEGDVEDVMPGLATSVV